MDIDKGLFESDLLNKALDRNVVLTERIQELEEAIRIHEDEFDHAIIGHFDKKLWSVLSEQK
jgi:hypothetical protein